MSDERRERDKHGAPNPLASAEQLTTKKGETTTTGRRLYKRASQATEQSNTLRSSQPIAKQSSQMSIAARMSPGLYRDPGSAHYPVLPRVSIMSRQAGPDSESDGVDDEPTFISAKQQETPSKTPKGRKKHITVFDSDVEEEEDEAILINDDTASDVSDGEIPFHELPDDDATILRHPEQRRITLNLQPLSADQINASLPSVEGANRTPEEVQQAIETHPGFRIQIWYKDWESVASTPQELSNKVQEASIHWYHGIAQLAQTGYNQHAEIARLQTKLAKITELYQEEIGKNQRADENMGALNSVIDRLRLRRQEIRNERDAARYELKRERDAMSDARQTIENMKYNIQSLKAQNPTPGSVGTGYHHIPSQAPLHHDFGMQQHLDPALQDDLVPLPPTQQMVSLGNNGMPQYSTLSQGIDQRHPDPPIFSGDDENVDYRWWRESILMTLSMRTATYNTRWKQVGYVRSRTGGSAWNRIRARSEQASANKYANINELFADLDPGFMDDDPEATANKEIQSNAMKIRARETFPAWLARFNTVLAPIYNSSSDSLKKTWFLQALSPNSGLYQLALNNSALPFQQMANAVRTISSRDIGTGTFTFQQKENNARGRRDAQEKKTVPTKTSSTKVKSSSRGDKSVSHPNRPDHIWAAMVKEKRCGHCGEKGHQHWEPSRPCINLPRVPDDKIALFSMELMTVANLAAANQDDHHDKGSEVEDDSENE
jgi:hypothetical protein